MDRNTIIGMVLIIIVLIGFGYLNRPSQESLEAARRKQDSIAQVEFQRQIAETQKEQNRKTETIVVTDSISSTNIDKDKLGVFAPGSTGEEQFITLENNLMKVKVSTKGGRIYSVELKDYKTYDSLPLILFEGNENSFGLNFFVQNRSINTNDLFFQSSSLTDLITSGPEVKKGREGNEKFNLTEGRNSQILNMKLPSENNGYIEYQYTISHNSYMIGFNINIVGLGEVISSNTNYLNMVWNQVGPRLERKTTFGDRYVSLSYRYFEDDIEKLSPSKSSEEILKTKVQWVSFKQLFFNSSIISNNGFPTANIRYTYKEDDPVSVGDFFADIALPYQEKSNQSYGMSFYFGPNHYTTLKQYDLGLDNLIDLGYSILRPINKYLIIPVFNFLRNYIDNFGIIILLLTIFIKLLIFPFTYKSFISQAKMKALKPEMDEIAAKYPSQDKAMEKQQAIMAMYKKAGVSPMGGCLPMLLQMPILFAMFFFFPGAIELRHESFLWAKDLSSYDSILNLPFNIPFYGSHVSLFCLLMTISTIISTKFSSQASTGQTMPGMQTMMYIMPVMFLFILNSYPSGLSYYYFLSNIITVGQMFVFRRMIDEDKIRLQLQANKKKPVSKSNWQKRLEKIAKERGVQMPKK